MWNKIKSLDHYRRSVLVALPVALTLLIVLIQAQSASLLLDTWFLDLITIPLFASNLIAGSSYIGRLFDFAAPDFPVNDNNPKNRRRERIGTGLGIILGLGAGIILSFAHATIPFTPTLAGLANMLFIVYRMNIFAGLGARVGSSFDPLRPPHEKQSMAFATILGFGIGVALVLASATTVASVAGFTAIFTGSLTLPLWASSAIFVGTVTSLSASFADYVSKAYTFLIQDSNKHTKKFVAERFHEYRGSFLGVLTGLALGIAVVTLLAVTQPYLLVGKIGMVTAGLLITTSVTAVGGLFSRAGRLGDGLFPSAPTPKYKLVEGSTTDINASLSDYEKKKKKKTEALTAENNPAVTKTETATSTLLTSSVSVTEFGLHRTPTPATVPPVSASTSELSLRT